jgi:hypothetical protein
MLSFDNEVAARSAMDKKAILGLERKDMVCTEERLIVGRAREGTCRACSIECIEMGRTLLRSCSS